MSVSKLLGIIFLLQSILSILIIAYTFSNEKYWREGTIVSVTNISSNVTYDNGVLTATSHTNIFNKVIPQHK